MKLTNNTEQLTPNAKLSNEYDELINSNVELFMRNLEQGKINVECLTNKQKKIIAKYRKNLNKKDTKEALKNLWKFFMDYKFLIAILFLVTIVSVIMNCLAIFCLKYMTELVGELQQSNNSISNPLFTNFCLFAGFGIFFYFINAATMWWQTRAMAKLSQKVGYKIRAKLFKKIQKLPISYFDRHSSGDLMSRFTNDVNNITDAFSENLAIIVNGIFMIIAMLVTMFLLSPLLTVITIAMLPIMFLPISIIVKKTKPIFQRNQKQIGELNGFIEEMISGQAIVTLFQQEELVNNQFKAINDNLTKEVAKAQSITSVIFPYSNFFTNICWTVLTVIGIVFVILGINSGFYGITLPDLSGTSNSINANENLANLVKGISTIAIFSLVSRNFFLPFAQISNISNILLMALAGANRAFQVFYEDNENKPNEHIVLKIDDSITSNQTSNIENPHDLLSFVFNNGKLSKLNSTNKNNLNQDFTIGKPDLKPIHSLIKQTVNGTVDINHLNFGYVSNKQILYDVCINAKQGETIAIVGPTGSGKSTIINLLTKFYDINDGDIRFGNQHVSIKEVTKKSIRKNISIVPQDTFLFNVSIKENIGYGKPNSTYDEIIKAAKTANAHNFIMQLPNGYDTVLDDNGSSLSQGQRQLLAISRAILSESEILVLDEATSSIDTKTEIDVQIAMSRLMKNKTSFVIAHRLSTIKNANQILVLKDGHIIERGTHDQLVDQKGFYYNLLNQQFNEEDLS